MQKTKISWLDLLFCLVAGVLFTHLILGIEKINPVYTTWLLLPGSDYSYHYLAWEYFKDSPWSWPLGRLEGYAYPMYNSVMYTDSIPLLALVFKLFRFLLPADFQYFGLWYFSCYTLNGIFGVLIANKIGYFKFQSWLISIFFMGAVVLVARFGHAALCGQWLLLWSLYIYISRKEWGQAKIIKHLMWSALLAALIHPYLFFMVLGLNAANAFQLKYEKTFSLNQFFCVTIFFVIIGLFTWYASGAFLFKGQLSEGLGKFSANFNTFINAWDVGKLGPSFKYYGDGQGEGIGYLGLGILLLLGYVIANSLILYKLNFKPIRINWFFIGCLFFFIFSLSPKWTIGTHLLIDWKYNDYISRTFRGTGRFIWPFFYFILYWVFRKMYSFNLKKNYKSFILLSALIIQTVDLIPIWKRNNYVDHTPAPLPYVNEMKSLISACDKLIIYPPYAATISDFCDYIYFVDYAQHFGKPITTGYGARFPEHIGKLFRDSIQDVSAYLKIHPKDLILTNVDSVSFHQKLIFNNGGKSYQFERYRIYVSDNLLNEMKNVPDTNYTLPIKSQVTKSFSSLLNQNKDHYIILSIQQEGLGKLSSDSKSYLNSIESKIDSVRFGDSWLAVIYRNKIIREKFSKTDKVEDSIYISCDESAIPINVLSGGNNANANISSIKVKGKEYSVGKRGINMVILDSCGSFMDKVNFDSYISDNFFSR